MQNCKISTKITVNSLGVKFNKQHFQNLSEKINKLNSPKRIELNNLIGVLKVVLCSKYSRLEKSIKSWFGDDANFKICKEGVKKALESIFEANNVNDDDVNVILSLYEARIKKSKFSTEAVFTKYAISFLTKHNLTSDFKDSELIKISLNDNLKTKLDSKYLNILIKLLNNDLSNMNLINANFCNLDLTDVNFSNCNLTDANFSECNLMKVNFSNCNLTDANFSNCKLMKVNFLKSTLNKTTFKDSKIINVYFNESKMSRTFIYHSSLEKVNFEKSELSEMQFMHSKLYEVNFIEYILKDNINKQNKLNILKVFLYTFTGDMHDLANIIKKRNFMNNMDSVVNDREINYPSWEEIEEKNKTINHYFDEQYELRNNKVLIPIKRVNYPSLIENEKSEINIDNINVENNDKYDYPSLIESEKSEINIDNINVENNDKYDNDDLDNLIYKSGFEEKSPLRNNSKKSDFA